MSQNIIRICDGCGKQPINDEYTLKVTIFENLPEHGGWSTGHELAKGFDYCAVCKKEVTDPLLSILRQDRSSHDPR